MTKRKLALLCAASLAAVAINPSPSVAWSQFTPEDYAVMLKLCGKAGQGIACVYDKNGGGQIVGLATSNEVIRRIGGTWYLLLAQNIGFSTGYNFFYTTPDCTGTAYLETGDGQKSGATLVEDLTFFAQVADAVIWAPVGTPTQIQLGAEGKTPPPVSAGGCASFGSGPGPTVNVRPAVAVDTTVFEPPFVTQ